MTKLITETPDHPIPFLIGHLQTKHESPGHRLHRTLSGSAALWAETDCSGVRRKIDPRPSICLSLSVSHMPNNSFQKKNRTSQLSVSERFFFFHFSPQNTKVIDGILGVMTERGRFTPKSPRSPRAT